VHLVGFTIEIYYDARSCKRQIRSGVYWTRGWLHKLECLVNISWTEHFRKYLLCSFLKLVSLYTVDKGLCYSCHTRWQCRRYWLIKLRNVFKNTKFLETESQIVGAFANSEKRLLASSCLSVFLPVCPSFRPSAHLPIPPSAWKNLSPTGRIFMEFVTWEFFSKICREFSNFSKIWQ
jgi:hypothetical protein